MLLIWLISHQLLTPLATCQQAYGQQNQLGPALSDFEVQKQGIRSNRRDMGKAESKGYHRYDS